MNDKLDASSRIQLLDSIPIEKISSICDSKDIDFLYLISDADLNPRLPGKYSSLPWAPTEYGTPNRATEELINTINIDKKNLYEACESTDEREAIEEDLNHISSSNVSIDYFSDFLDRAILEELNRSLNQDK